jgi:peptidoglycan/LPS O-acetylase OafA/YrhL
MTSVTTRTATTGRIPGVEGLRAIAASSIMVMHLWWVPITAGASFSMAQGWPSVFIAPLNEGVPMFFVLSGFLLWRPMASAVIDARQLPSIRRYARNRVLRILPAYWVVLLSSALILESARVTPAATHAVDGAVLNPGLLLQDALLVQNLRPSTMSSGLSPAWSLAVEVVFYALLPVLALCSVRLATRRGPRGRRLAAALAPAGALLAVGVLGKLFSTFIVPGPESVFVATWHSVIDSSFLTHADLFAFGMVIAVLRVEHEGDRFSLSRRTRWSIDYVLTVFAVPILILGFWVIPRYIFDPLIALLCAMLLARVVLTPASRGPARLVRVLERRPFVALGYISYSVFLWNYPIAVFLTRHGLLSRPDNATSVAANLAVGVPIVLAFATATYLLVERPALKLRRPAPRLPAPVKAAVLAAEGAPLRPS